MNSAVIFSTDSLRAVGSVEHVMALLTSAIRIARLLNGIVLIIGFLQ